LRKRFRPGADAGSGFSVQYTWYRKAPDGQVSRISSGSVGPFPTRQEAQAKCDWYNSLEENAQGVRYYSAKVVP
jgi:hypothetical protein